MKNCRNCKKDKDESEFSPDKKSSDGLHSYCKECKSNMNSIYYIQHPEKRAIRIKSKEEQLRNYYRNQVHQNVARVIRLSLGSNKNGKTFDILGYTIDTLKRHLEDTFQKGMTWDNYGDWHIDHIIPRDSLPYKTKDEENFKKCWKLSNLQSLWKLDNLRKGNKIINAEFF